MSPAEASNSAQAESCSDKPRRKDKGRKHPIGKRVNRPARTQANIQGQGMPTLAQDGRIGRTAMEERCAQVAELARDGWGMRAIARKLGVSLPVVNDALVVLEREAVSRMRKSADAWRDSVLERLDDTRTRLLEIARGNLDDVGVADRISAERALILAESQRAKVLGLHRQPEDEAMGAFVQALVNRRRTDADGDVLDAELVDDSAQQQAPGLPAPAPDAAAAPIHTRNQPHVLTPEQERIAAEEAKAPHTKRVKAILDAAKPRNKP